MIRVGLYSEDRALHLLLSSALGKDFQLLHSENEADIRNFVTSGRCDVVVLDIYGNHLSLEKRIECSERLIGLQVPTIILANEDLYAEIPKSIRIKAFGYCRRPPSIRDLKALLQHACEDSQMNQQPEPVDKPLIDVSYCDRLIGSSAQMQHIYQLVRKVCNLNATVLVTGESGTGKELIARAIHALGPRAGSPFVAISGGAIPETLIESELFGHASGAFTGAEASHEGYFEKAGEGTLFFDEIGELSLFTQVKLLRVLQELEFSRLGSTRLIPLRARLIFATNRDLSKLVAQGTFRQDLYYRINVLRIQAPSLQEHLEDIPSMARHCLRRYSKLFGKPMESIEPEAMELLMHHSWPGNVRELENVIQRAIIDSTGLSIRAGDVSVISEEDDAPELNEVLDIANYRASGNFEEQLRKYKTRLVLNAVRQHSGNKALAARSLGMSRAYLYQLIGLAESDLLAEESVALPKA